MFKNISFIISCFKLNVKKEWQYKTAFFMQIFLMVLNNLSIVITYLIMFTVASSIGDMVFNDAIVLFAISAGGFGVMRLFFTGSGNIKDMVWNARLDVYMTQPKNLLLNISCSSTEISAIGDIISGFIILGIAGVAWWWYIAYLPIAIISGLVYFGMYVFWHTFVFYIKGGDAFSKIAEDTLLKVSGYPRQVFDTVAKVIFATVIPVLFFTYIPVENILLDFNFLCLFAYFAEALFWLTLAFTFFRVSVRRYNSGSVMGGRD